MQLMGRKFGFSITINDTVDKLTQINKTKKLIYLRNNRHFLTQIYNNHFISNRTCCTHLGFYNSFNVQLETICNFFVCPDFCQVKFGHT